MRQFFRWVVYGIGAFYGLCALLLLYLKFGDPIITAVQIQHQIESLFTSERLYTFVPLHRISGHLQHAVIAAEDGRFFQHGGIDWLELRKAMKDNWQRGRLWRGGSTITQQLVKNLFFTTHQPLIRKVFELPLVFLTEFTLSKRRILELYLNVVEWGPGVYGAEAAARYHYGTSAASLNRNQAARLAACLPAPRSRTPQEMGGYGAEILNRMDSMGW